MKTYSDYHIHSIYSKNHHGKSELEEIVKKAIELKLEEIAISDHGLKHFLYGVKKKNIKKIRKEIDKLSEKYPQIKILHGIEANITSIDGDTDIDNDILENCDIILMGFHYGVIYKSVKDVFNFLILNFIGKYSGYIREKTTKINTDAIIKALRKYNIDILTHPGDKMFVDIEKIAEVAEKTNTMLEINNSHGHLSVEELKLASKYNVKFVINSDAHIVDKIGTYEKSLDRVKEADIDIQKIVNLKI